MINFFKSTRVTMKNILLSSVAIVAFAGVASAEGFDISGSATLGFNDEVADGVYVDSDIDITASTELNNGWTAAITYGFELAQKDESEGNEEQGFTGDDNLTLSLTDGTYTLTYGDTQHAAVSKWSGVSDMAADAFSEQDGEDVLKVEADFGDYSAAVSGIVDNDLGATGTETGDIKQASFGAAATFGAYTFGLSYQEEDTTTLDADLGDDYSPSEVLGVSASTSFAGADITVAYAKATLGTADTSSTGIEVSYPVGDVTLGAFYVSEDDDSTTEDTTYGVSAAYAAGAIEAKGYYKDVMGNDEYGIGAAYTMGDLVVTVGHVDGNKAGGDNDFASYIIADYDLGGGASVMASFAEGIAGGIGSDDIDTILGGYELMDGATVALGFKF
jgi:outer membrane protein OmpU